MTACRTCGRDLRCNAEFGTLRCQGEIDHPGDHWADNGTRTNAVLRWGVHSFYGCPDPSCVRKPGHPMPHRDGRGHSWEPYVEPDAAYDEAKQEGQR